MSAAAGGIQQRESSTPIITILVALFIGALVVFAANFVQQVVRSTQDQRATALAADIQVKSQQLAKYAAEAAGGRIEAFDELRQTQSLIATNLEQLSSGDPTTDVPPISANPEVEPALTQVVSTWTEIAAASSNILAKEDIVLEMTDIQSQFEQRVPLLQARSDEIVKVLAERGAPGDQIYIAGRQVTLADRLLRRLGEIMQGDTTAADGFNRDAAIFGRVLDGLQNGNAELGIRQIDVQQAQGILGEVRDIFLEIGQYVEGIVKGSSDLADVQQAADTVSLNSNALLENAKLLEVNYSEQSELRPFPSLYVAIGAGVVMGICLLGLGFVYLRDQQRRLKVTAELNQRNQEAILRLLDEMGSLAEGDLTVRATVTEDITGAIADSINFAVEALRSLVTTINETAVQVAAAAQETQATAMHLAEAAEHQAQQITSASAAINEIAVSIDEVSRNSAESADVAQRSVQIAGKGAAIVRQTIQGMDNIRDQIQETSKRIKRLGESSQEIGSIVELINDIAEQTNILALNAAIQAASAGEAGRGFAVVADEVQRLAERASNATKRIETLVQTIQSDTNEAVSSMEQTTAEVVAGARLAEDAGLALGEIEKVSNDLADLIQNISEAARQQSAAATNISATMNVIQEITTQTSVGASQTAESIGNLAQLAADLRRSVADFKLPT
ncbi:MAG: methyl-accepting chemotaxis protein [Xanthomonadales bacterium]|nr:methyl-accepting chemotaxis protein [Xanthomonadales bacterium]MCB1633116.1 methyl-accepting chemotaxis protein [Xanthomonadales bacterium]